MKSNLSLPAEARFRHSTERRHASPWCALVLAGAMAMWATACTPKTHVPIDVINEHASRQFLGQIKPGWNLRQVGRDLDSARKIVHRVEVGPERAGEILMMSGRERNELVSSVACPQGTDPIWEKLTPQQDVIIDLRTDKGNFETISCRSAIF